MEKTISLRGIVRNAVVLDINRRCYHTFALSSDKGVYKVFVRHEDTEWDIENGGHYWASGMEIADGLMIATSVDRWGRVCDTCGKWHTEGYYVDGEYACSEECAIALYDGDADAFNADLALLDNPATADYAETYWTEWD